MKKTLIYYFSGTGNSLVVARDVAAKTGGELVSLSTLMDQPVIKPEAEVIGIIFPVYHAIFDGLPLIVERFVGKLGNLDGKYLFAICTCRGWSRLAIRRLADLVSARSGKLAAGFTVAMPDNTDPLTVENQQKRYAAWKKKLGAVSRYINDRRTGRYENTTLFNIIMAPFGAPLQKATVKLLEGHAKTTSLTFKQLLPLTDNSFIADGNCTGCGICSGVCPVGNIKIMNQKPVWQNRCESCLACLNFCPKQAISGSVANKKNTTMRYHHPDIKAADLMRRDL
jgi:ferredoxin